LLPLAIGRRARKVGDARKADRESERPPHGSEFPRASRAAAASATRAGSIPTPCAICSSAGSVRPPVSVGSNRSRVSPVVARPKISRASSSPYRRVVMVRDSTAGATVAPLPLAAGSASQGRCRNRNAGDTSGLPKGRCVARATRGERVSETNGARRARIAKTTQRRTDALKR
jgi:hypothetical protein